MKTKKEEKDFSKIGKRNRINGRIFESKVRQNLEEMGWVIDKWTNTVDYEKWKIVPAKKKFNPFMKIMTIGTGFPDFIAFKKNAENYEVIGVEVKSNGYLDKIEKDMCIWLLENKIFSRILIAKKSKKISGRGIEVEYVDFIKKYKKDED